MLIRKSNTCNKITAILSQQNLLLANAIFCFGYAVCYLMLTMGPFAKDMIKGNIYAQGVIVLNSIFLVILSLNLNTIIILYKQLLKPRKFIRVVYFVTTLIWLTYIIWAYANVIFLPGFLSHFYHYMQFSFRTVNWLMTGIILIFGTGLSILFREYYRQIKMSHILFFIIPAILQFSFKIMLPFLLFIMAWFFFGGCQLLLYFSINDHKRYPAAERSMLLQTNLLEKIN